MNTLDAVKVTTPYNTEEDCARFTITDGGDVFKITGAMLSDREYTFSGWIRAESECSVVILQVISQDYENGEEGEYANALTVEANTDWQYVTHTFTARTSDLDFIFGVGTFYIYHAQLELGNKATDWTPNPEDVDQDISNAEQSANEYANNRIDEVATPLVTFKDEFDRYIKFLGPSAISIGSADSAIVLRLDNKDGITFEKNGETIAYWDGNDFKTGNIYVETTKRAQFGAFAFVPRTDGSMSFLKVGEK